MDDLQRSESLVAAVIARAIRTRTAALSVATLVCATADGCRRSTPVYVAVQFETASKCAGRVLSDSEQAVTKRAMFETLQHAAV